MQKSNTKNIPLLKWLKSIRYFGFSYKCPCCNSHLSFFLEYNNRIMAACPICSSLERHRFLNLFIQKEKLLSGRILHIAPEPCLSRLFIFNPEIEYITTDLNDQSVTLMSDIMTIPIKDSTFTGIICSHVLEYVTDDMKVMSELFRILTHKGWALIIASIDINDPITIEYNSVKTDLKIKEKSGQENHVRKYGNDIFKRLIKAGFSVTVIKCNKIFTDIDVKRFGLSNNEFIIYCKKVINDDDIAQ